MAPTYNEGDWLLVRWQSPQKNSTALVGRILVIEREERPGIFLIKRLQKIHGDLYWVQGDNESSTDSRTWGWITANEIIGVVTLRIKKQN